MAGAPWFDHISPQDRLGAITRFLPYTPTLPAYMPDLLICQKRMGPAKEGYLAGPEEGDAAANLRRILLLRGIKQCKLDGRGTTSTC